MKSTIKDVARKANVSVATVSRVLNNLPGYSEDTRKTVLQVIDELGYQPNAIARGLINKRTDTIGVLFPSVSSSFSSEILCGIEDYAHDENYSVVVCNTAEDGKRTLKYLQVLREKQVDGIIFSSAVMEEEYYNALRTMDVPVVMVATQSEFDSLPYVKVDDWRAAYDATTYLIQQGHREIAMMGGYEGDLIAGKPRIEGYKQALIAHGIPVRQERIFDGGFHFGPGCKAAEQLLDTVPEVTAVFAASDEMAIALISIAAKRGISVPEQISVIGYDNLKLAEMSNPPLTTIAQPLYDMGKTATEKLVQMIHSKKTVSSLIVDHQVIERNTVKKMIL